MHSILIIRYLANKRQCHQSFCHEAQVCLPDGGPRGIDLMDERAPLATVVIVNYNYDKFVAAAIDSALEQSYAPLEVIVVDDGSSDGSRQIIAGYANHVRTVFQNNAGQGSAYNAGWRAARGEFVLFLDSDHVLTPDAMTKVVAAFQESDAVKVQFYL